MPRKLRTPKERIEGLSDTAMWILGDKVLYPEPENLDRWEEFNLGFPTCTWEQCRTIWESASGEILPAWFAEFPGTRPSWWWLFSAPRMNQSDLEAHGWKNSHFARQLCEPRRRLGGTGTAAHDVECCRS